MYSISYESIIKGFPKTIKPPVELEKLVKWANENEHKMGGSFELYADEEGKCLEYWSQSKYLNDDFAQFGIGPSGAPTGIWRDDDGTERIVYLHDEERWGDVIADSFLNYLRILAIGYDDVNESCDLDIQAYNKLCEREDLNQGHNPDFKNWVEKEFKTIVPATGDEVFIKERNSFNDWLTKTIRKHAIELLAEYPLFEYIGKDLRTLDMYAGVFLSAPLGKAGKTYFTIKNYYGIKAILNEDYTIRHLTLGGNNPKLSSYRHENPAALESSDTRAVVIHSLGEPTKKGRKDKCEYYLYKINSKFGLRTVQIFFNPNLAEDNLWKIVIK
jgi:hypothetical protein